jgi:hypothetical protein
LSTVLRPPQRSGDGDPERAGDAARQPRRRAAVPLAFLAFAIAAVATYAQRLGWNTNTYTNDEWWAVRGGRLLERDFFGSIADTSIFERGPDRLNSLLQVVPNAIFDGVPAELRAIHVVLAACFALAAVPVYLMARGLGLPRWPAVLVGALAIATPWALFAGTFHNVTVAYPANMLFAWAAWRAALRPSVRADALVLAAAALNAIARTGHLPLIVVALLAVAYASWLRRPAGETGLRALGRLPLRVAGTHPLLVGTFLIAAVVVLSVGTTKVVGSAYSVSGDFELPLGSIWDHTVQWFSMLTMATGYLPMLVGAPWLLRQIARPTSAETGIFAVVAVGLFAVFCYASGNSFSTYEERYVAPFAALPVIAFGAAVFRREAWPLGTAVLGLIAVRALTTVSLPTANDAFEFLPMPAKSILAFPLAGRVATIAPGGADAALVLVGVAVALAGLAVTLAFAPAPPRIRAVAAHRPALALAVTLLLLGVGAASGAYAMQRYQGAVHPERSFERMAFIDRATGGERAFLWGLASPEDRTAHSTAARTADHFNRSVCCTVWIEDLPDLLGADGTLPGPPARYLVRFEGYAPLGFEARQVARSRDLGLDAVVLRFDDRARAAVRVHGAAPDGTIGAETSAGLQMFTPARQPGRCVSLRVRTADGAARPVRLTLTIGTRTRTSVVRPGEEQQVAMPIRGAGGATLAAGRAGPVQLSDLAVARCAAA